MPDALAKGKPNSADSLTVSKLAVYDTLMTTLRESNFPLPNGGEGQGEGVPKFKLKLRSPLARYRSLDLSPTGKGE
jgi:hypothetical protein